MKQTIYKRILVRQISIKLGITNKRAREIFSIFVETMKKSLHNGESIHLRQFGSFEVRCNSPKKYYNPITKKIELSSKKKHVIFRPSSLLLQSKVNVVPVDITIPKLQNFGYGSLDIDNKGITHLLQHSCQSNKICYNRTSTHREITVQEMSGNVLLPNKLNFGARVKADIHQIKQNVFQQVGIISNSQYAISKLEGTEYPFWASPVDGTPILDCIRYQSGTGGVTEPVLFHKLLELKNIESDIDILQSTSLPIRNRNYGYKPDIAIIWKEKNIYLDIEVDEPYDIVSRKPIHYKGCADQLRNAYFLDNGWYVLRFAEQQIVENLDEVKKFISNTICIIANDIRFEQMNKLEEITRWTYDEAQHMEKSKFREKLLGLKSPEKPKNHIIVDEEYNTPKNFDFVKPNWDIIENRFAQIQSDIQILTADYKYIIIENINLQYDYVCSSNDIKYVNEKFEYGIKFFDIIEQKDYFVPYKEIHSFYGTDTIFKKTKYENNNLNVRDALIERNPIKITYTNSAGDKSSRNVVFICPWYNQIFSDENKKIVPKEILLDYAAKYIFEFVSSNSTIHYFCGYCTKRKEIRTFSVNRISNLQVYKCRKPGHIFTENSLWQYLEEDLAEEAELMFQYLPEREKNKLIYIGNLCNALVMQNKTDEALDFYMKYSKEDLVLHGKNWHDVNLADIDYFEEHSKYKANFTRMRNILQSKGW